MTINENTLRLKYILGDFITANISWFLLNLYRFHLVSDQFFPDIKRFLISSREVELQVFLPFVWILLYYFSGYYNNPLKRARLEELKITLTSVEIGTLGVFFFAIINDVPHTYVIFYKLIIALFSLQFLLTYGMRVLITQRVMHKVHRRILGTSTLVVGTGERALNLMKELDNLPLGIGCLVEGFVNTGQEPILVEKDKVLGKLDIIEQVIKERKIREIIVASDSRDERNIFSLLNRLYKYNLPIQVVAGKYNVLSRAVKISGVFAVPMFQVTRDNMSEGQKNIKWAMDVFVSAVLLILLSPLFIYLIYRIKKDSPGAVFYYQERIGYRGRPFTIIKFRTMMQEAELAGPQLSSEGDERITPFGHFMRKYRLDELPQLWNILKGEMSLVGPRPERKYFVDKIIEKAPYYCLIYNIKPGLTSWATVKNGYANTMEKMIERLKYDIIYLESRSLAVDIKILFYTLKTIFSGKGM